MRKITSPHIVDMEAEAEAEVGAETLVETMAETTAVMIKVVGTTIGVETDATQPSPTDPLTVNCADWTQNWRTSTSVQQRRRGLWSGSEASADCCSACRHSRRALLPTHFERRKPTTSAS